MSARCRATAAPRRRSGWCTSGSATSSARTRRGTPTAPATAGGSPRSPGAAPSSPTTLNAQDGLYTLVSRAGDGDRFEVIGSLARAHPAARPRGVAAATSRRPACAAVTITVTEAGYLRGADGGLDASAPRSGPTSRRCGRDPTALVRTAPARLLAGLAARRRADAGPLAARPVRQRARATAPSSRAWSRDLAELVEPGLRDWLEDVGRRRDDDGRPDHAAHRRRRTCAVPRHRPTTAARSSPSRSASGCSAARSPAGARAGRTPARRSPTTSRRSSSASCGCSTAATRCWPTPARSAATTTVAEAVADDDLPGVAGAVVGGGVART